MAKSSKKPEGDTEPEKTLRERKQEVSSEAKARLGKAISEAAPGRKKATGDAKPRLTNAIKAARKSRSKPSGDEKE